VRRLLRTGLCVVNDVKEKVSKDESDFPMQLRGSQDRRSYVQLGNLDGRLMIGKMTRYAQKRRKKGSLRTSERQWTWILSRGRCPHYAFP
jgi:hypothetical protein